jgi:hypothetical protein
MPYTLPPTYGRAIRFRVNGSLGFFLVLEQSKIADKCGCVIHLEEETAMPIIPKASFVEEFANNIEGAISEIVAQNNHCGVGAPTPERIEKNLEKIRNLEAQLAHLQLLSGL